MESLSLRILLIQGLTFVGLYVTSNRLQFAPIIEVPGTWVDRMIPLQADWVWIYLLTYPFVALPAFFAGSDRDKIAYAKAFVMVCALSALVFFAFPTRFEREASALGSGYPDIALGYLRFLDAPVNCVPSMHVSISYLGTLALTRRFAGLGSRFALWALFLLICYSTLATKQHLFFDVLSGAAMGLLGQWAFSRWVGRS